MLVLIATDAIERTPHVDRDVAVEGELVTPVVIGCGADGCVACQSAWFGLVSHGGTPTAMVVDRPGVTEADVRSRLHDWLDCSGVVGRIVEASEAGDFAVDGVCVADPVSAIDELISDHIDEIRQICETFPVGTIVSRLGRLVAPQHTDRAA